MEYIIYIVDIIYCFLKALYIKIKVNFLIAVHKTTLERFKIYSKVP
jgi:hypothetical protein